MSIRVKLSCLCCAVIGFVAACESSAIAPKQDDERRFAQPGSVPLIPLPQSYVINLAGSGLDSIATAVRAPIEWITMWPGAAAPYVIPPVDFRETTILVASAGQRPGHGWSIRIDSAFARGDTVTVHYREYASCATTGAIVRPWHVVAMDRHDGPIIFQRNPTVHESCRADQSLPGLPLGLLVGFSLHPDVVVPHASLTAVLTIANPTADTLRINTPDGCLATPRILRDTVEFPFRGSNVGCVQGSMTWIFPPRQEREVRWNLHAELYSRHGGEVEGAPAPSGTYRVRAEFRTYAPYAQWPVLERSLRVQ